MGWYTTAWSGSNNGRLTRLEARQVARQIESALPGWRAVAVPVAQGVGAVETTAPDGKKVRIRSEAEFRRLTKGEYAA